MICFDREMCCNIGVSATREWLVTNGIGGYACGTVAGMLTRRYHGLLIASLNPPVSRVCLVTKLDETATYGAGIYPLYVNRWRSGYVDPDGYRWLGSFHLEGTTPVWTFPLGNARLEKRIWMQPGANTTYIRYTLVGGDMPATLEVKALVNYRDHHSNTHAGDWQMLVTPAPQGVEVLAYEGATSFYLLSAEAPAAPEHIWLRDFYLSAEEYQGYDAFDDNLYAARFEVTLQPEASCTFVATLDPEAKLDGAAAYAERQAYEAQLLEQARPLSDARMEPVILAADQFLVKRSLPENQNGCSVIAGYPWFADWGRDAMIGLPGLTLATGKPETAQCILRTYRHYVTQGMLPNHFPDAGQAPEYNAIDATLWYIEGMRSYFEQTGDLALLQELFPVFEEIIRWHREGTRYNLHADPQDGLLYAGEPGIQLTWMGAKVGDWVVTPRMGKPVEINALWYNALCTMADFARALKKSDADYKTTAEQVAESFERFWNDERYYCYDVLDGPEGNDPTLRPNQLFAVALPHSPLSPEQQRAVVEICEERLLIPKGVRSLGPEEPAYIGHYGGDVLTRDAAYHQGTAWGWLLGLYVIAHLQVYGDTRRARAYMEPMFRNLEEHGVGNLSEIFDGDPPYAPRGCIAQAWTVALFLWADRQISAIERQKQA